MACFYFAYLFVWGAIAQAIRSWICVFAHSYISHGKRKEKKQNLIFNYNINKQPNF